MKPGILLLLLTTAIAAPAGEFSCTINGSKGEPVADAVVSLIPLNAAAPAGRPPPPRRSPSRTRNTPPMSRWCKPAQKWRSPTRTRCSTTSTRSPRRKNLNCPSNNPGAAESLVFDVSGVVTLGCNIHDWMLAYLVVVPTPYFAKSDGLGAVNVSAPAGRYRLELWHPRLAAPLTEEITLTEGTAARREFSLTLKADRRIRRGPGSKTGGYR